MEKFCGSQFWDVNLTWYTSDPRFTPCFEKTIVSWIPVIFLWIGVTLDIVCSHTKLLKKRIPWTHLSRAKATLATLLIFLEMSSFTYNSSIAVQNNIYPANILNVVLKIATFLLYLYWLFNSRKAGFQSPGVQFGYWLLLVVFDAMILNSAIRDGVKNGISVPIIFQSISYVLIVVQFIISCWTDVSRNDIKQDLKPNPEDSASFLSKTLLIWLDPLIWKGFRRPLTRMDLWELSEKDKCATVAARFDRVWNWEAGKTRSTQFKICNESTSKGRFFPNGGAHVGFSGRKLKIIRDHQHQNLIRCLIRLFGGSFLIGVLLKLIQECLALLSPVILYFLIAFLKGNAESWKGYFYAVSLFVVAVIQTILTAQTNVYMYRTSLQISAALVSAIYRKSLLISNAAKIGSSVGNIVNYMDVDVETIINFVPWSNILFCTPIQICMALYMLYTILGHSIWAGVAVMIIFNLINMTLTSTLKANQIAIMKYKDLRVNLMNQILTGIKVLKLYGWEPSFSDEILKIRKHELEVVKKNLNIFSFKNFFLRCTPFFMSIASFLAYVMVDDTQVLDAQTAFVSLALFDMLRTPIDLMSSLTGLGLQAYVGLKRISNIMNTPEIDFNAVTHYSEGEHAVSVENGNFSWDPQAEPILKNLVIKIQKGSLTAVVGLIGSGKSTLLSAILGEIEKSSGLVNTLGSIGYVSQQAWIQNGTLRDNILFGKPWNKSFYKKVLKDCALESDLVTLPAGDFTEIGEKGINLSGGQKQRVSLARAVYSQADIYLLDDPLSAVDCHVGRHIFDNVLGPNGTLRKTTRILVTHGIAFLRQVDYIIVMKDGRISELGTYQKLLQKDQGAFGEFLKEHMLDEFDDSIRDIPTTVKSMKEEGVEDEIRLNSLRRPSQSEPLKGEKIISVETCEENEVKSSVYLEYFRSSGWPIFAATLLLFSLFQATVVGSRFWLKAWTSHSTPTANETMEGYSSDRNLYMAVYGGFGLAQGIGIFTASYALSVGALRSTAFLHLTMLQRIMKAPLWFFETTPIGRILNRFSKDVNSIDNKLPIFIRRVLVFMFEVFGTLFIICYTFPVSSFIVIPIGALFYFTQRLYVATSRQLTRLDSVSRSPIYSHFGETISGGSIIRAYRMQHHFIKESERKTDENLKASYPSAFSARWVEVRLEIIGNTIVLLAALFAVIGREWIDDGLAGLVLSSALLVVKSLSNLAIWFAHLECGIVSVERLTEYHKCVQEASWEVEAAKLPKTWPERGVIEFDNYHTRYREGLPLCLNGVTCRIEDGEKIGIVGRTGAGKSSFALSLFRIIEPTEGTIRIDGVDITKIGLHDLRRQITVIPQDPTLFSGTLRLNLDPESLLPDEKLWRALKLVHLKGFISTLPDGLDHEISEGGENFSVGQRQLVCLARALLRKTKVLVMDEATAAVDLDTDDLIQQTIRAEFSDTTVLTVAHRLNTIMDSTRVLVLDKGRICEFDTPSNLLQLKSSVFYSLAKEAGLV